MAGLKDQRTRLFVVLTGMYIIAYFYRVSAAVIADDLARDLHLTPDELGTVSSVLFYGFALTQLPLGPLMEKIGARYTIVSLGVVTSLGALILGLSSGFAGAFAGRLLIGVGTSCVLMASLKIYMTWFSPAVFATLAGAQMALGNTGNLLATAPLAWLADTIGWRGSFFLVGGLTLVAVLVVLLVVRDRPAGVASPPEPRGGSAWVRILSRPDFWRMSFLAFFWYGSYMAVQGLWGGPYLRQVLGYDRQGAGLLLFLVACGFILGCPVVGRLSDRVWKSRKRVLLVGQFGLLALTATFLGPLESFPPVAVGIIFFLFGVFVSTGPVIYAQTKELFPLGDAATAMTLVNFSVVLGAAVVQQAMGHLLKGAADTAAFQRAFALPVCGLLLSLIFYCFCRDTSPDR